MCVYIYHVCTLMYRDQQRVSDLELEFQAVFNGRGCQEPNPGSLEQPTLNCWAILAPVVCCFSYSSQLCSCRTLWLCCMCVFPSRSGRKEGISAQGTSLSWGLVFPEMGNIRPFLYLTRMIWKRHRSTLSITGWSLMRSQLREMLTGHVSSLSQTRYLL